MEYVYGFIPVEEFESAKEKGFRFLTIFTVFNTELGDSFKYFFHMTRKKGVLQVFRNKVSKHGLILEEKTEEVV